MMRHLQSLDLAYTKVTDNGLKELPKLKETEFENQENEETRSPPPG